MRRSGLICLVRLFFSSRRRHTRCSRDWSSDVCSSERHKAEQQRQHYKRAEVRESCLPAEGRGSNRTQAGVHIVGPLIEKRPVENSSSGIGSSAHVCFAMRAANLNQEWPEDRGAGKHARRKQVASKYSQPALARFLERGPSSQSNDGECQYKAGRWHDVGEACGYGQSQEYGSHRAAPTPGFFIGIELSSLQQVREDIHGGGQAGQPQTVTASGWQGVQDLRVQTQQGHRQRQRVAVTKKLRAQEIRGNEISRGAKQAW